MNNQYTLEIAGLCLRIEAEFPLTFHKYLQPFVTQTERRPDVTYRLRFLSAPPPKGEIVFSSSRMTVFYTGVTEERRFTVWSKDPADPVNPALLPENKTTFSLYCPPEHTRVYTDGCELTPMLALEQIFAERNRLILHASVVRCCGEAVLFCAPSGVGKSTQAALWQQCFGAEILNGDRCVIEWTPDGCIAHGSAYSGSSEICKRQSAPIRGLLLLSQAPDNSLQPATASAAFRTLFAQTVINLWDPEQVQRITQLLTQICGELPIYQLACRPDTQAAELAKQTLFP